MRSRSARAALRLILLAAVPCLAPNGVLAADGDAACVSCHKSIYDSYQKTIMARASGKAADGLVTGEFFHRNSGVKYGIFNRDGRTWMAYQREGERGPRGQRELLYYIGSGRKGRSYLFSVEGFLFETPINWYSQEGRWNMAPAYTEATEIPMNLPSLVDCLNCHTTGMQAPIKGTDNRFAGKPFTQGGIGCARCHGPGQAHLDGKGPIVNPAKLPPERRDSVCMECHFEGTVAIEQRGKHLYEFRPGDDISDYIHYFLLSGTQSDTPKAVSQFEAFAQSMCKRKSGDKMSCLSCHDPHVEPSGEEKAAYYRGKCLACHGARGFAAKHHPEEKDCTKCHMPALPSKDVAHTQATDHRILRYANGPELQNQQLVPQLIAFPAGAAARTSDRDLALAWETLSQRKIDGSSARAEQYLRKSLKETPDDPVLLGAMAFIEQERGHDQQARDLYERTLKLDPEANEAAVNLGVLEARNGNLGRSIQLWKGAFDRVPYRSAVGLNLAMANCAAGRMDEARRYVQRVMDFNPDSKSARRLLEHLSGDPVSCKP